MSEWCECLDIDTGYTRLDYIKDEIIFVHHCGKPSFLVWKGSEKWCDECGGSFSSPTSDMCRRCWKLLKDEGILEGGDDFYHSWKALWAATVDQRKLLGIH